MNRDGDIVRESFSVKFILHSLWYTPLVYVFMNLFSNVLWFFFSQPDVNITWITRHIHRSIVDKIDPTCEYVEMEQKKPLSITLGYIFLWNVIRRIYLPCFNWSVKILLMNRDEDPLSFFNLKSGRMANNDIFSGKLFTRSVCCFGYTLGIDFNW